MLNISFRWKYVASTQHAICDHAGAVHRDKVRTQTQAVLSNVFGQFFKRNSFHRHIVQILINFDVIITFEANGKCLFAFSDEKRKKMLL